MVWNILTGIIFQTQDILSRTSTVAKGFVLNFAALLSDPSQEFGWN